MPLTAGSKLGHYEIHAPLGVGGMGEVYRARDTKLGRDVALKVLPAAVARDAERMARFQREAQVLASLNHPNIAAIHGLEEAGGVRALVMELVEGPTLAERLSVASVFDRRTPVGTPALQLDEALGIATQIAEALEAAHEKGIIHRDLKPANIKITPQGTVKVLDFGLAKALDTEDSASSISNSPTLTMAATEAGVILGTAAYMSPEQAKGKKVDRRADIWSFGCVLYEMLAGRQVFSGETVSDVLAAVIRAEPDWDALPATTPRSIRKLVTRCLEKDSKRRLQAIGEARITIEETVSGAVEGSVDAVGASFKPAPRGAVWRRALLWGGTSLVLATISGLAIWNLKPTPSRPVTRTVITLPSGDRLAGLEQPAVALSPDGTQLVYVASRAGTQQLYLRAMDSLEARPIPGTEGAINPFFSPDGQWLGFFAAGKLQKVSLSGGVALTLCDAGPNPPGASWGSQGTIIFAPLTVSVLQQLSDGGGAPHPLTRLAKGEASHRWPDLLPGGKAVLFAAGTNPNNWTNARVAINLVGTGERRDLIHGGTHPRYAPSGPTAIAFGRQAGYLVYAQGGNLMAVPFDPQRLEVTGAAVPVVEGVLQSPSSGAAQYSFSVTGALVYVPGGLQAAQRRLVWVNRNGAEQPLAAPAHAYRNPRLSPDGRRAAVEQESQVWLYDLSRETLTRLTFEGNTNAVPAWTPDGKRIAFQSIREGPLNIFWQLADGSGGLEQLTSSGYLHAPNSWSPDGQLLAFIEIHPNTRLDIWVLRLSDRKAQPFLRTPFNESAPRFSPDGRWLAYVSDESSRFEVYVQPYPGPGGKWQISTEGGTEPMWNSNGRELFYRSGDKMMAVEIAMQPGFSAGKPRVLFEGHYLPTPATFPNYDVSPGGQRFLMLKPVEAGEGAPTQINVVLNWFEELKRRVPAGKSQ